MAFAGETKLKSAQARYAAHAAEACGYAFQSLDGVDGYLFEIRDGDRRAMFAAGAGTPYALNDARAAALARDKAFSAAVLRHAGLPVLPHDMFFVTERWSAMRGPGRELRDALAFVADAAFPIFCKPISASNGLYAERIDGLDAFQDYVRRVSRDHFAILIQPYVRATEYRVFVLDGTPLFSYRKTPASVVGDGERALRELIEAHVAAHFDEAERRNVLPDAPRALSDVPKRGEVVVLAGPANRSAGGGARGLRGGAPEKLAALAVAATEAIGLRLAGVDMFDLSGDGAELAVIEVNSNPMIATLEDAGRWDVIDVIWRANIDAALK